MNLSLLMTKPKQISYVAETGFYQTQCLMQKQFLLHRHATLREERCQYMTSDPDCNSHYINSSKGYNLPVPKS